MPKLRNRIKDDIILFAQIGSYGHTLQNRMGDQEAFNGALEL